MSQRFSLILGISIAIVAAAYFWWRGQAEQQINSRIDLFVETVEFEKLSLDNRDKRHSAFAELFTQNVAVAVPAPVESGDYSRRDLTQKLDEFHQWITYFKITEMDRSIVIDGDSASALVSADFRIAMGPNWKEDRSGSLELHFINDDGWRIHGLTVLAE
ncbi:MAG: hypothetical protein ACSHYF_00700 [Verrucomicrobiaceae bacterium]